MRNALVCLVVACAFVISPGSAQDRRGRDQDTGTKNEYIGTLIERDVKPGPEKTVENLRAKTGDLLQFRITSPQLGRAVLSLQVAVDGDARKVAVVSTPPLLNGKPELGSRGVSVFVVPERRGRAMVRITFIDNEGKAFRRTYDLELVER
jgi:hypothetical protein